MVINFLSPGIEAFYTIIYNPYKSYTEEWMNERMGESQEIQWLSSFRKKERKSIVMRKNKEGRKTEEIKTSKKKRDAGWN